MEIYRGRRLWIEKGEFSLPNGEKKETIIVHPGDAVVILPRIDDSCLLIRQWRTPIGQYIYEAPAGTMEPGELPIETARRELIEETGMEAEILIPRGYLYTTPGFTDERLWLFEARNLHPSGEYEKDDDEVIEPVTFSVSRIREMIMSGEIVDAKTIGIVYRCMNGDAP
ncbi:MAG: NUDIX hydrolase [Methanospirillum sp.]|nr:NUDIX hydrolase [Methanospirillum sp.]